MTAAGYREQAGSWATSTYRRWSAEAVMTADTIGEVVVARGCRNTFMKRLPDGTIRSPRAVRHAVDSTGVSGGRGLRVKLGLASTIATTTSPATPSAAPRICMRCSPIPRSTSCSRSRAGSDRARCSPTSTSTCFARTRRRSSATATSRRSTSRSASGRASRPSTATGWSVWATRRRRLSVATDCCACCVATSSATCHVTRTIRTSRGRPGRQAGRSSAAACGS